MQDGGGAEAKVVGAERLLLAHGAAAGVGARRAVGGGGDGVPVLSAHGVPGRGAAQLDPEGVGGGVAEGEHGPAPAVRRRHAAVEPVVCAAPPAAEAEAPVVVGGEGV